MVEKLTAQGRMLEASTQWFVYILRCADDSLYTGITLDVGRRLKEHNGELGASKGAKSLRGKSPLKIAFTTAKESRSEALKLEYKIKQLSKANKEKLVAGAVALAELD